MNIVTKMFVAVGWFAFWFAAAVALPGDFLHALEPGTVSNDVIVILKIAFLFIGTGALFIPIVEGG